MCDCISDIERRIVAHVNEQGSKHPATKAEMREIIFPITKDMSLHMLTAQRIDVYREGKKRPETTTINHNFCPFCGTKYETAQAARQEAGHG